MSILTWIVLGLVAGFIASLIMQGRGNGIVINLVLGVAGAFVGGGVFHYFGKVGVTGFNLWSVVVASVGAVLVIAVYHLLSGRRVTHV
ncbi:MAG: GlsB/YeaQ/YmgE family stress response membrane protein [Myxococcota bacterium]|jgi:uncharacterized membrane protein YeaQ/YmgE (transglycosylase-associated protein family)|nr:GlsB/YeaQ/YmgE family stress response membrane protein [Myxococcota bacterium]